MQLVYHTQHPQTCTLELHSQYGHSQGGLNGIAFHENATQQWDLSLHICSGLNGDLLAIPGRLCGKHAQGINSMDPVGHPISCLAYMSDKIAATSLNVHNARQNWMCHTMATTRMLSKSGSG